jgi:hypothetical protein
MGMVSLSMGVIVPFQQRVVTLHVLLANLWLSFGALEGFLVSYDIKAGAVGFFCVLVHVHIDFIQLHFHLLDLRKQNVL